MALTSLAVSSLFFLQLSLFVLCYNSQKPEIDAKYETILIPGDNFTVLCQGHTPLTWSWPKVENFSTVVTAVDVLPKSATFKYASRLIIHDIRYPYTGFYICHDKNSDPSHDDLVSKIYLYVRDEEHLAVNNVELDNIIVTQYSTALLPCRPTSPDVDVKLTLLLGEPKPKVFLDILDEEGVMYRFHPHFGIYTNNTKHPDAVIYTCNYIREDHSFSQTMIMEVEPYTHFLPKPILEELSDGHTLVGQNLTLGCKVKSPTAVNMNWITPTGAPDLDRMSLTNQTRDESGFIHQNLIIRKATLKDKGAYHCNISDNQLHMSLGSINISVYAPNEHFINLTEDSDIFTISVKAGSPEVRWRINVNGHPKPSLFWLNNKNETIFKERTDKYTISVSSTEALLKIKDIEITDFGNYTLVAENEFETKALSLFLNVTDKPTVHINTKAFHMVNEEGEVKCIAAGYPEPSISWRFKPCLDNTCRFEAMNETKSFAEGFLLTSVVKIKSIDSGYIECAASNSIGEDKENQLYNVTDVKNGFDIFAFDPTVNHNENEVEVGIGEKLSMTCGASIIDFATNISWVHKNKPMQSDDRFRIDHSRTDYTNRITLIMENATFADAGMYSCQVNTKSGRPVYKNMTVKVSKLSKPVVSTNLPKTVELRLPNQVKFMCNAKGVPKPTITWYKGIERIYQSKRIKMSRDNQLVHIESLDYKDEGIYKCVAQNKVGQSFREVNLKFKNKPENNNMYLWIIIGALSFLAIVFLFCVVYKIRVERKLQRELETAGLANFEKGAIESLNPELGIDDQAELLPYDKKWEFPIEKLKLGKQLGSGAFGVVVKGIAKGIIEGEESSTVAVKMVRKNADYTYIKALASELKIMVHLGKHLNVVNLLGACTKNVAKRELLVIVEFCRFGNIQNYLLRHRENFINQVDPQTSHLDYTIGQEELERTYSVSSSRSNQQSPYMKYAALSFADSGGPQLPHMMDYRGDNYNVTTAKTDITTVSMSPSTGDEEIVLSNNSSVQPEWRSNYHGDYKGNTQPICTKNLLLWAFQVSRGMEYLASRKVLHGDLAARNILLADHNVVKICDFGLAKSMYKSDNYKKKGDGPLPVKWMAIESIRDKMFSTQSDVWSFGIVLWELFSLARTPYPGMEADERLFNKLLDGYRMESPEYAPKEIYKMMTDCWQAKPVNRPTFSKLSDRIGSLLEDTVRKHYIDLNDPYLVMNTQRLEDGHSDYLAMLSPPDFENLSSPHHYANDLPPSEDTSGYLSMDSAQIFSPRADDDRVFSFELNKTRNKKPEECKMTELVPMLRSQSESDSESTSPIPLNSFSNPSYHLPPIVENGKTDKDIVKSADNYVNMPQNKTVLKDNNPFFSKMERGVKDPAYVNSNSRDWESVKL